MNQGNIERYRSQNPFGNYGPQAPTGSSMARTAANPFGSANNVSFWADPFPFPSNQGASGPIERLNQAVQPQQDLSSLNLGFNKELSMAKSGNQTQGYSNMASNAEGMMNAAAGMMNPDMTPGKMLQEEVRGIQREIMAIGREAVDSSDSSRLTSMSNGLNQTVLMGRMVDQDYKMGIKMQGESMNKNKAAGALQKAGSVLSGIGIGLMSAGKAMISAGTAMLSNIFTLAAGLALIAAGTALKLAGKVLKTIGKILQVIGLMMEKLSQTIARLGKNMLNRSKQKTLRGRKSIQSTRNSLGEFYTEMQNKKRMAKRKSRVARQQPSDGLPVGGVRQAKDSSKDSQVAAPALQGQAMTTTAPPNFTMGQSQGSIGPMGGMPAF